jgi:DnaJ-class molecular chaperone
MESRRFVAVTPAQRTALSVLRRYGATDLSGDMAEADLKRAFRTLARRYHPDCHGHASSDERARLAAAFADVAAAYRTLLAA